MTRVVVSGAFDDLRSADVRFLQEAAGLGELTVLLWPDAVIERRTGGSPIFPLEERRYLLESLRYVSQVNVGDDPDGLPVEIWTVPEADDSMAWRARAVKLRLRPHVVPDAALTGFPLPSPAPPTGRPQAIVTGCYDWLHSGHVRFFEEVAGIGELHVSLGSDRTIRGLKGEGHPMLPQEERLYMVQSVRYVHRAFIGSGSGYLDAAPDIERLRPQYYVVNEDGDRPEKAAFCRERGIEYVVLKRLPRDGLPARQSTHLRGF